MTDTWLPVVGFVGRYEVSDTGLVRSLDTIDSLGRQHKGQLLKPYMNKLGYKQVVLGHRGSRLVHHLVLEAFAGKRPPGCETRHLDGDPRNNNLSNLRWGSSRENKDDMRAHGTMALGEKNGHAKISNADVEQVHDLRRQGLLHREIAEKFGVSRSHVTAILNGTHRKHYFEATRRRETIQ